VSNLKKGDLVRWKASYAGLDVPHLGIVVEERSTPWCLKVQWLTDNNTVREHYAHELVKAEVEGG
jgi:hypothetical protein